MVAAPGASHICLVADDVRQLPGRSAMPAVSHEVSGKTHCRRDEKQLAGGVHGGEGFSSASELHMQLLEQIEHRSHEVAQQVQL